MTACHRDVAMQERLFRIQKRLLARRGNLYCAVGEEVGQLGISVQQVFRAVPQVLLLEIV